MSRENPRHLERGWKSFEREVMPPDASAAQRHWMRAAFYGGALVAFSTLTSEVSQGDDLTPEDIWLMADIDAELSAFQRAVNSAADRERASES